MTPKQAAEIMKAVAAKKKRGGCTYGRVVMLNNNTSALVEVHTQAAPFTVRDWFLNAGADVLKIETTRGQCIVEFRQPKKVTRS